MTRQRPELDDEERDLFDAIVKCAELSANGGTRMDRKQREQVSAPLDPELLDIVRHVAELAKKKLRFANFAGKATSFNTWKTSLFVNGAT